MLMPNPWRVGESDDEDDNQSDVHTPLPSIPSTPKYLGRRNEPRILDWDPVITEEKFRGKYGHRRTAPSFEHAPSDHRPIFSGPPSLKSSSNSLFEQMKTIGNITSNTPPASPSVINSNFDPMSLIQEDLRKFIYTYVPQDHTSLIQCSLRRDRSGIQGFLPTFYLHFERPSDGKKALLLTSRKVAKINRQSEYTISTNVETLSEKSNGDGYVGKLREINITGTEYTLYDNGTSRYKYKNANADCKDGLRRELAAIIYNTNFLGLKGPRQINIAIPDLEHDVQPTKDEETILDLWRKRRFTDLLQLRNRPPTYSKETKSHMLQFAGNRVVEPSIKNFQLVMDTDNHQEEVVMQFGRLDKDTFACDYRYPLSAIQAFGIALSSFDSRFSRE